MFLFSEEKEDAEEMQNKYFCDRHEEVWFCRAHCESFIWGPSDYDCLCIDSEGEHVTTGTMCG